MCSPLGLMGRELCCKEESGLQFWTSGRGQPRGEVGSVGAERDQGAGACDPLNARLPKG